MPYPNEHSCRLEDPAKYDNFNRKNCEQKHEGKCIDVIYGVKGGKSEVQALRYPKKVWEEKDARDHCKSRGGSFEPAEKEKKEGGTNMDIVNKESFKKAYPDLFAEIDKEAYDRGISEGKTQGRIEGSEAERNRIKEVEGQLIPGHEAVIQELKYDGKTTGPEAAVIVLKKENEMREQRLKDIRTDGSKVSVPDAPPPDVEMGEKGDDEKRAKLIEDYKKANPKASERDAVVAVSKQHPELFKDR
jgi:hypothetical protein